MPEIADWNRVRFKNWDDISYNNDEVSSFWGKTFFYYDKAENKLYCRNFTIIERLLRAIFGYMREYNRESFWQFLQTKKIVQGDCPAKNLFRYAVGDRLGTLEKAKETFFQKVIGYSAPEADEDALITLFENGLDLNAANPSSYMDVFAPALWEACYRNCYKVARYLIERGADVNSSYVGGYVAETPFHALVNSRNLELAQLMLHHGLDLDMRSHDGQTPLQIAIEAYNPATCNTKPLIQALLEKNPDIDAKDIRGKTALCYACAKQDPEIVQWLLDKGANAGIEVPYGACPLNIACASGNFDIVNALFAKGASIAAQRDRYEWGQETRERVHPPLLRALDGPHMPIIELLLEKGADVNQGGGEDGCEELPLSEAVRRGHSECAALFLAKGAKINEQNRYGYTALYTAAYSLIAKDKKRELAALLLKKGANPNLSPHFSPPLLHQMIEDGNCELLELLLREEITDREILKRSGTLDQLDWTPLHFAAYKGQEKAVEILLRFGANRKALDRNNKTAADIAKRQGNEHLAALLTPTD